MPWKIFIKDVLLPSLTFIVLAWQVWLTRKQADISDTQIKNNREAQRARIKMPADITFFHNNIQSGLQVLIENKGNTAAENVRYYLEYQIIDSYNLAETQAMLKTKIFERKSNKIEYIPEVMDFSGVLVTLEKPEIEKLNICGLHNNNQNNIDKKPFYISIWGSISYKDVFGGSHQIPFLTLVNITIISNVINTTIMPIEISKEQQKKINGYISN